MSGRLTHGHSAGYLTAGLFADVLQRRIDHENTVEDAIIELDRLRHPAGTGRNAYVARLDTFLFFGRLPADPGQHRGAGKRLGCREALAIAVWCALTAENFEEGVIRTVNHSGDSDSTGLLAGHLLGLQHGFQAIPDRWYRLELRNVIVRMASYIERVPRVFCGCGRRFDKAILNDYPLN
jgi:ADP-ribosylglycohydrolase